MFVNCNVIKLYCNVKWIVSDNAVLLGIYCIFLLCTVIQLGFSYWNICIVTCEGIISVSVSIIIIIIIIIIITIIIIIIIIIIIVC